MKNADAFLAKWKGALMQYRDRRGIKDTQGAIFSSVGDRECCGWSLDSVKVIEAHFGDPLTSVPMKPIVSNRMRR